MNEDLFFVIRIHPIYLLSISHKPRAPNLGSHLYSHLRTNYCFWQGFHWHLQKDLAFWFHRWTKLFQLILFVRKIFLQMVKPGGQNHPHIELSPTLSEAPDLSLSENLLHFVTQIIFENYVHLNQSNKKRLSLKNMVFPG